MSSELVTLTIDGREVQVPKGTGLVETALAGGIEIPVFCYEPRVGPPLGACRMCLVEVEGMPKLQAACTLAAQDGMVVRTAATSDKSAEGQNAVLEFILLNHPLDCPDCDKGGECPLQDLTFRYGPGTTRMRFAKRTFDKPIPISPLIALDRERCILCYRCTRFSEQVAEDGQLVARERGANSYITTFEDEPYRAHFSGNVVELCPVGALTSTAYRFRARPWEIQSVPTVCGLCPAGCNLAVSTREGKVVRVLSRNHPEVDQGWICDKGRFAYGHLGSTDRIAQILRRVRRRGFEAVSLADAVVDAEAALRSAGSSVVVAFSGTETQEEASAVSRLVRGALGSDMALLPEEPDPCLDEWRSPLSTIADAEVCVVFGDEPVVERAPIVDLWLRAARRAGAELITVNPAGTVAVPPGGAAAICDALVSDEPPPELAPLAKRLRSAGRVALVWSEDDPTGGRRVAALAHALGIGDGCSVYWLPAGPTTMGVAAAWRSAGEGRPTVLPGDGEIGVLIVLGDDAAADPSVLALAERARYVLTSSVFMSATASWSHLLLPGASYLERDGTVVNLEGRPQRQHRAVEPPGDDLLAFLAALAGRFGVAADAYPRFDGIAPTAELPPRAAGSARPHVEPATPPVLPAGTLAVATYRPAFAGVAVDATPALAFQQAAAEVELSLADARARGIASGDVVVVGSNGNARELHARVNRRLREGVVRIAAPHATGLGATAQVTRA